jgi:hypothetical protein
VSLSPEGSRARDRAAQAIAPIFDDLAARVGGRRLREALPTLRAIRSVLDQPPAP